MSKYDKTFILLLCLPHSVDGWNKTYATVWCGSKCKLRKYLSSKCKLRKDFIFHNKNGGEEREVPEDKCSVLHTLAKWHQ